MDVGSIPKGNRQNKYYFEGNITILTYNYIHMPFCIPKQLKSIAQVPVLKVGVS